MIRQKDDDSVTVTSHVCHPWFRRRINLGLELLRPIYFVDIVNNNDYKTKNKQKKCSDLLIPATDSKRRLSKKVFHFCSPCKCYDANTRCISAGCFEFICNSNPVNRHCIMYADNYISLNKPREWIRAFCYDDWS